jgi:hypothetical protein
MARSGFSIFTLIITAMQGRSLSLRCAALCLFQKPIFTVHDFEVASQLN